MRSFFEFWDVSRVIADAIGRAEYIMRHIRLG